MQKAYSTTQFKHTDLWNGIIDHLRATIQMKKHRCGIKSFENCFTGTEFVDILFEYLLSKQHQFENEVTKDKVKKIRSIYHGFRSIRANQ